MLATAVPTIEAVVSAPTVPVTSVGVKSIAVRDFVAQVAGNASFTSG